MVEEQKGDAAPKEEAQFPQIYISDEKLAELKEAFGLFDHGGSTMATHDLGSAVRSMGQHPTEAEIAAWMQEVDKTGSGHFEFEEFRNLMATKIKTADPEDEIRAALMVFDKEGNGTISAEHLREVMTSMGEVLSSDEVEEMIQTADTDNDGIIHYEEFLAMLIA